MNRLKYGNAQIELVDRTLDVTRVGCKFSRVRSIERQHYRGRAARAIVNGKLGHASCTDDPSDDRLIRRALDAAHVEAPLGMTFPDATVSTAAAGAGLTQMTDSDLRAIAEDMLHSIGQGKPEIVIELEVRRKRESVRLRNTRGGQYELSRTCLESEAWVERHSGSDILVISDHFSSAGRDGGYREFARRMARRLRWARRPLQPRPGPQSVILSPSAFASLLRPMLFQLNGAHTFHRSSRGSQRRSGLATRIGQQMFDSRFSLRDDATLPDRPHSASVDHEGIPGQRTPLIECGTITGFYHNLHSAALAETRSTGNGWRWMMEPPHPTLTNVVIGAGPSSLSALLRELDNGLLIDSVMGSDGSTGLRGDFSRTVALAYPISHGRAAGFVKGIGIGGNLYRSLENIEALSCDGFWAGNVFAPYIQIGGVTVTV